MAGLGYPDASLRWQEAVDTSLDLFCRSAPPESTAPGANDVSTRDLRLAVRQERCGEAMFVDPDQRVQGTIEDGREATRVEPERCGSLGPAALYPGGVQCGVFLVPSGGPGHPTGPSRAERPLSQMGPDLSSTQCEATEYDWIDPIDPMLAVTHDPFNSEPFGKPVSKLRLVEGPGRTGMGEQAAPVECAPAAVGPVTQVGHHDMAVEVRVQRPTDPVGEPGAGETTGRQQMAIFSAAPAHCQRPAFDIPNCLTHRLFVGAQHLGGDGRRAQGEQETHRFGGTDGQVIPTHRARADDQAPTARGAAAREHPAEHLAVHRPAESESAGRSTHPPTRPIGMRSPCQRGSRRLSRPSAERPRTGVYHLANRTSVWVTVCPASVHR